MTDSRPTSTRRRALKFAGLTGLSGVAGLTGLSLSSQPALAISGGVNLPSGLTEGAVNVSSYELQYAELDTASEITVTYILRNSSKTVKETHTVYITESTGTVMTGSHSINVPAGEVTLQVQLEHPSVGTVSTNESSATTVASAIPTSGVSRYEFEQDVTDSWGSNDGTDNTSAGYTTTAQVGSHAKSVDGTDDYVDVGILPLSGSFSVSMWANPSSLSSTAYAINNYGGYGSNQNHYVFGFGAGSANNDEPVFQVDDGSTIYETIAPAVTTGSYAHVVGVFDDTSDEIRIYTNGTRQDTTAVSTTPDFQERSTWMGESRNGGNCYEGVLDDPRFYNKALSDTEASNLESTGSISG